MTTREVATLGDLLRYRAAATPDRTAFVFQSWRLDEPDEEELTYRGLLARSLAAADALKTRCRRRDRALILCPPGLDYIVSFFACQLAGLVAVPVYPPRNVQHMGRLRAIIEDADASAILTPEKLTGRLTDLSRSGGPAAAVLLPPLIAVDSLDGAAAVDSSDRDPGIGAADLTYLQYTSGTTGRPKGVMVSHAAALAQLEALQDRLHLDETDVGVFWLPLFHDMGLVGGMLQPLFSGFPCYMMAPTAFAQRPMSWLRTISRVRGTFSYAPNFAYDLCVSAFDPAVHGDGLDLSCWSFAGNASEIVRAATLQRFADRFAPYGFVSESLSPCFGLAEFTLIATARTRRAKPSAPAETASRDNGPADGGEPGEPRDASGGAVGCGSILDGQALKIVDPDTAVECAAGETGEVWLSGPSVAGGYWHRPEETEAAFGARLAEDPGSGHWLRTGDKGALVGGELRLLGRFKEMIIVRGRNHYAQDLEESVAEACPGLKRDRAAAFGVVVDPQGRAAAPDSTLAEGEERVVVIQELDRSGLRRGDTGAVCDAMRRAITRDHEVEPYAVVLIKPATLPRTSSGKIERTRARTLFLSGGLAEVDRWQRPGG